MSNQFTNNSESNYTQDAKRLINSGKVEEAIDLWWPHRQYEIEQEKHRDLYDFYENAKEIRGAILEFLDTLHQVEEMIAIYPDTEIFLNEIERYMTEYMLEKIQACPPDLLPSNIQVIKGKKKSTKLEGQQLDKIIIRNTFHHFAKPEAMLESIQRSLKPSGQVFLLESWAKDEPQLTDCDELWDRSSLLELFQSAGFRLVQEQSLAYGHLLQFQYQ